MKYCKHGVNGDCCCNCNNQIKLFKHPGNAGVFEGSILEESGYCACEALFLEDDNENKAIAFDSQHGMCELYDRMA